jgi:ATP-dependent Lon protease
MSDRFFRPGSEEDFEYMPIIAVEDDDQGKKEKFPTEIPILPLRNTVLFPGVVIPITVGRDKSIKAVREAYGADRMIGVISQIDHSKEEPSSADLYQIGTIAKIFKMLRMPDGSTTAIIQGKARFKIESFTMEEPFLKAQISLLPELMDAADTDFKAIVESVKDLSGQIIRLSPNIPSEANIMLKNIDTPAFLINFVANNLQCEIAEKQIILELNDSKARAQRVLKQLEQEIQMLELKNKIQSKVRTDIEKQQKDFFLQQQLKTIQEELGHENSQEKEMRSLRERAEKKKWSEAVAKHFDKEVQKLSRMNPAAAEYSVIMNYLELLLDLPWESYTKDKFDLRKAAKILADDHYGLEKVKDRILEYLAVLKLKGDMKSPILCFVGPPGVGKTSLGKSIAKALGRKYVRMSLGGLHDEAEIRGHRKTYIGAMPGRIIQSLKKAQSSNPVFVLDEIDKVGTDFRGDPSSALLEVLDPEQNSSFYDQFLELEYNLSKVMFIATANSLASIQPALRDRMEIIDISGYSVEEKMEIAKRHLIPKQLEAHGLKPSHVSLNNEVLQNIIEEYTRESGVRELDRKLASIMRNTAKKVAQKVKSSHAISKNDLSEILGMPRFDKEIYQEANPPGVAVGLAWTPTGGEILYIESLLSSGKGNLKLTGNLGDVMKESASTALTFIKAKSEKLNIKVDHFEKRDLHIHVPEGAIPKDGPSAGITMLTSIASIFSGKRVKPFLAMTGEITLRGKVLPVGGIKEKILAARRAGMKEVLLCKMNEKDVKEINPQFISGLKIQYVENMQQVLDLALMD